jgi:hypothetical protein
VINELKKLELSAVVFVRNYLQLQFDGPLLNVIVWPEIRINSNILKEHDKDYRNILCSLIGSKINVVIEDQDYIILGFSNGVELYISLKYEDRRGVEALVMIDGIRTSVW